MPNRRLTDEELAKAKILLDEVRLSIASLSGGDKELAFAYNRKISKELTYDERGKPMHRKILKLKKFAQQGGKCFTCTKDLPEKYTVLDRINAIDGYTAENTNLICTDCDTKIQASRGYA